jgi:uncharacterized membrane protein YdjX (TVP38/TMEM64 family)
MYTSMHPAHGHRNLPDASLPSLVIDQDDAAGRQHRSAVELEMKRLLSPPSLRRHATKVAALAFWLAVVGIYYATIRRSGVSLEEGIVRMAAGLTESTWGPLLFILLYVVGPLLFVPATLLSLLGGFMFGPIGIIYTILGSNASAMVAYSIGHFFGGDFLKQNMDSGLISRYAQRMRTHSFETVLIMHLIFLPYELVNYAAGLMHINWKAFLAATAIGSVAATISIVMLGASFGTAEELLAGEVRLNPVMLISSFLLIGGSIATSRYLQKREARQR